MPRFYPCVSQRPLWRGAGATHPKASNRPESPTGREEVLAFIHAREVQAHRHHHPVSISKIVREWVVAHRRYTLTLR